jgi:3',5'-nucleoside bisphosphate phosphatase
MENDTRSAETTNAQQASSSRALKADFHVHTVASDGAWSVDEVIVVAAQRGVDALAITDHDTTASVSRAMALARDRGIALVPGIELSAQWRGVSVHVVGLMIDIEHAGMCAALAKLRATRAARGQEIGAALQAAGIDGAYEGALAYAGDTEQLSRTHFARYLVSKGYCSHTAEVFTRYMKPGKPGYVPTEWMEMSEAIGLIHSAGGRSVLAHPARYDVQWHGGSAQLVAEFKAAGGDALEVICAAHSPSDWSIYAAHCRKYDLHASLGSDFHSPRESRLAIGDLPRLPSSVKPVWTLWNH